MFVKSRALFSWVPPLIGSMKLNVDGSALDKPCATTVRGGLLDHNGIFK